MYIQNKFSNFFERGRRIMTDFILAVKKSINNSSSPFSIYPETNYKRYVPKNAKELMKDNWINIGVSLKNAMKKVGEEIGYWEKTEK